MICAGAHTLLKLQGWQTNASDLFKEYFEIVLKKLKETGYISLVRPLLEYCSPIWNPYRVGQAQEIEMV